MSHVAVAALKTRTGATKEARRPSVSACIEWSNRIRYVMMGTVARTSARTRVIRPSACEGQSVSIAPEQAPSVYIALALLFVSPEDTGGWEGRR